MLYVLVLIEIRLFDRNVGYFDHLYDLIDVNLGQCLRRADFAAFKLQIVVGLTPS